MTLWCKFHYICGIDEDIEIAQRSSIPCPSSHSQEVEKQIWSLGDVIQPFHPLLPSSPPAFNLSQHQGLFQWVNSSKQVVKLLQLQLQHQSFQRVFRVDFLLGWLVSSPCIPRVFSSTTVWKHWFFGTLPSLWSSSHSCTWLPERP